MLKECDSLKAVQDSQLSHGSIFDVIFKQLMVLAKIRAQVVFPTPLGPQNKKDCAKCSSDIALLNVEVIADCPTTSEKVEGRYFLADTMKFPIKIMLKF